MLKGILLAGGSGTRLYPVTAAISKQLLPIYDKPMIYYPLSVLMLAGIREILIIVTPQDAPRFEKLLGNGSQWGLELSYAIQKEPRGIAEAFIIGQKFVNQSSCALILGDNFFYGSNLPSLLNQALHKKEGATIFAYQVHSPSQYGVIEFTAEGHPKNIVEKPLHPTSRFAVTGLYVYDSQVVDIAKRLTPSQRNELEITDINNYYLTRKQLEVKILGRGMAWLDTGTFESLLEASFFIQTLQKRQGVKIACPEEIAYKKGYITAVSLEELALTHQDSDYGNYLLEILSDKA